MPPVLFGLFSVSTLLFLIFGSGALATAIVMVLYPNPVRSALMLVLNLFCVAVLYLLLNAYFLAAIQIIVYAGAIMVLFLFVIMLLNLGSPDRSPDKLKWQQPVALGAGLIFAGIFSIVIFASVPAVPYEKPLSRERPQATTVENVGGGPGVEPVPAQRVKTGPVEDPTSPEGLARVAAQRDQMGTVAGVGKTLYNPSLPWLFPFEMTSFLLLIAVIGSVVLAKRRLPGEPETFSEAIVREEIDSVVETVLTAEGNKV